MRKVGALVAVGLALLVSIVTLSLLPLGCGENKDPCTAGSAPLLALYASVAGLVGVVASLFLRRSGFRSASIATTALTTVAYLAWLAFLFQ